MVFTSKIINYVELNLITIHEFPYWPMVSALNIVISLFLYKPFIILSVMSCIPLIFDRLVSDLTIVFVT